MVDTAVIMGLQNVHTILWCACGLTIQDVQWLKFLLDVHDQPIQSMGKANMKS
jgi:hypothetical protein